MAPSAGRRPVLLGLGGALLGGAAALAPATVEEVAPGVFVLPGAHEDASPANDNAIANVGFVVGGASVAVVDPGGSLRHGQRLRRAVEAATPLPIRFLVLTHAHPDHVMGATAFADLRSEVVGHARLPEVLAQRREGYLRMMEREMGAAASAGSDTLAVTRPVEDRLDLDLGGAARSPSPPTPRRTRTPTSACSTRPPPRFGSPTCSSWSASPRSTAACPAGCACWRRCAASRRRGRSPATARLPYPGRRARRRWRATCGRCATAPAPPSPPASASRRRRGASPSPRRSAGAWPRTTTAATCPPPTANWNGSSRHGPTLVPASPAGRRARRPLARARRRPAQGIEPAEAPRRAERWRDLKEAIFDGRPTEPAGDALTLVAPARALDAAAVPVSLSLSAEAAPRVRAIHLVIDENPAPVAAVFRAGPAGDLRALSTRVRVDAYTLMHAVAETEDGRLLETARFVKAAGGCSAPVGTDLRAARERMGRMRMALPEGPPGPERAVPVQVAVSHPNTSGLQMDQLTRLFIPAEFVRTLRVLYRSAEVLGVECDISIAENPTFGFTLAGEPGGELRVEAEDNRERRFAQTWTLGTAG